MKIIGSWSFLPYESFSTICESLRSLPSPVLFISSCEAYLVYFHYFQMFCYDMRIVFVANESQPSSMDWSSGLINCKYFMSFAANENLFIDAQKCKALLSYLWFVNVVCPDSHRPWSYWCSPSMPWWTTDNDSCLISQIFSLNSSTDRLSIGYTSHMTYGCQFDWQSHRCSS